MYITAPTDQVDPDYDLPLQNYSEMYQSTDTKFEAIEGEVITTTPTSDTVTDGSSVISQNPFPSLVTASADDIVDSGNSDECNVCPHVEPVIQRSHSHEAVNIENIEKISTGRHRPSTKSYTHVDCAGETSDDSSCRHVRDSGAPHFSISDLVDSVVDEQWNGHDVEPQVVVSDTNNSDINDRTCTTSCLKNVEEHDNCAGDSVAMNTPVSPLTNKPTTPQLSCSNDLDEGIHECENDNEVALSFVEQSIQYSEAKPLVNSHATSSGISSGSYIYSLQPNSSGTEQ